MFGRCKDLLTYVPTKNPLPKKREVIGSGCLSCALTGLSNRNVFSALDVTKVALRRKRQTAVVADGATFIPRGL